VSGYLWTTPGRVFRQAKLFGAAFRTYDYDGNVITNGVYTKSILQLLNYSQLDFTAWYQPTRVDNTRTRGGPLSLAPPAVEVGWHASTDARRSTVFSLDGTIHQSSDEHLVAIATSAQFRPSSRLTLTVGPALSHDRSATQYISVYADPTATRTFGQRYVFAALTQEQLSAEVRLNWLFSPRLSVQLYAQPLIATGRYSDYKALAVPRTYTFNHWNDGTSSFDSTTFTPAAQDFNLRSLRGTLVLRWEYRPGSSLYVVWTQRRNDDANTGQLDLLHSIGRLTAKQPDNVLLVKISYWLPV
jgi:hypothetical protein